MSGEERQSALSELLELSRNLGYVSFDVVLEQAEKKNLSVQDFDWLTNQLLLKGVIISEEDSDVDNDSGEEYDDFGQVDYDDMYNRIVNENECLSYIISDIRNIKPPQLKELNELKYQAKEGNPYARDRIVKMYLRVAVRIAYNRAKEYDLDVEDAICDGFLGLLVAIDKYDPDLSGPFISYASMWIYQNITRNQAVNCSLVYYPVHRKELYYPVYSFLKKSGYNTEERLLLDKELRLIISEKFGYDESVIDDVLMACQPVGSIDAYNTMCDELCVLQDALDKDNDLRKYLELIQKKAYDDKEFKSIFDHDEVEYLLSPLKEREREIIEARFGLIDSKEKTLEEIGELYGLTRERIRQIERKALKKMRIKLDAANSHFQ